MQDGRAEHVTDDVVRPEYRHHRRILHGVLLRRFHGNGKLSCGNHLCVGADEGRGSEGEAGICPLREDDQGRGEEGGKMAEISTTFSKDRGIGIDDSSNSCRCTGNFNACCNVQSHVCIPRRIAHLRGDVCLSEAKVSPGVVFCGGCIMYIPRI